MAEVFKKKKIRSAWIKIYVCIFGIQGFADYIGEQTYPLNHNRSLTAHTHDFWIEKCGWREETGVCALFNKILVLIYHYFCILSTMLTKNQCTQLTPPSLSYYPIPLALHMFPSFRYLNVQITENLAFLFVFHFFYFRKVHVCMTIFSVVIFTIFERPAASAMLDTPVQSGISGHSRIRPYV